MTARRIRMPRLRDATKKADAVLGHQKLEQAVRGARRSQVKMKAGPMRHLLTERCAARGKKRRGNHKLHGVTADVIEHVHSRWGMLARDFQKRLKGIRSGPTGAQGDG